MRRSPRAISILIFLALLAVVMIAPVAAQAEDTNEPGEEVRRLYLVLLDREPDSGGQAHFAEALRSGAPLTAVASTIGSSPEFTDRFGDRLVADTNGDWTDFVYNAVFNREPDARGRTYWTALLSSGDLTRADMLVWFSESGEFRTIAAAASPADSPTTEESPTTDESPPPNGGAFGTVVVDTSSSVDEVAVALASALERRTPIGVVARIDHAANAAANGLDLPPTAVTLFGNPMLGTPLMQANPQVGLDLPQKMLVTQTAGQVSITYNSAAYLQARHDLGDLPQLGTIDAALRMIAEEGASDPYVQVFQNPVAVTSGQGLVVVKATGGVEVVYRRLIDAIEASPLKVVAELDHQANAGRVGMDLDPNRLVIFGNPNVGTPLMQASQSTGIDLPQKMLVYRAADGSTEIVYNDPAYLARRHGIATNLPQLAAATNGLANLANIASGN